MIKVKRFSEFEILRAIYMKDTSFWVMAQGTLIEMYSEELADFI